MRKYQKARGENIMINIQRFTPLIQKTVQATQRSRALVLAGFILLVAAFPAVAADAPWTTAAERLMEAFTGPIAKALSLVSIVVGGLMFAFGEGGSKRMLSG